jgi:hypothetical protein
MKLVGSIAMLGLLETLGGAGPKPPFTYSKSAVSFSSAVLRLSSAICTDNAYWGFAGWFKTDWSAHAGGNYVFVVDPLSNYYNHFSATGGNTASSPNVGEFTNFVATAGSPTFDGQWVTPNSTSVWHHIICAVNTQAGTFKVYVDDVSKTIHVGGGGSTTPPPQQNGPFDNITNGLPIWIGSDFTSGTDFYVGSMSDLSLWPGIDLMQGGTDISSTVRRLFTTSGAAASVDPTAPGGLIDTLGAPAVFLTGGASDFVLNGLGTNAALTTLTGSLSDDASPPP